MLTPRSHVPGGGRDATAVADAAVAAWAEIERKLAPTIGRLGVAALFRRSVHLAQAHHPWLAPVFEVAAQPGAKGVLRATLAAQSPDAAAAAAEELVTVFHSLLVGLVGEELTRQLLPPGRATASRRHLPKDSPP